MSPINRARQLVRKAAAAMVRPLLQAAGVTPYYQAQGRGVRVVNWRESESAINTIIESAGEDLRAKARALDRKNCWASNAVDVYVSNVVGTGIIPQFQHPDPLEKQKLQRLWNGWVDESDADGISSYYGQQELVCRTEFVAGESLVRFRPRYLTDGLTVPLQVQILEPEHLPLNDSRDLENGNKVRWGIEFDQLGRRVAYHLYKEHPGDQPLFAMAGAKTVVPASAIAHVFYRKRPGQQRGITALAPAMLPLYELEKYDGAELARKGLSAMLAFFIVDSDPGNPLFGEATDTDDAGNQLQSMGPISVLTLPPGKDIKSPQFADVGGMYPEYIAAQLRKIAVGMRSMLYEYLSGSYKDVTYLSARAALLNFRRQLEQYQHNVLAFQFGRPTVAAWLDACVLAGHIDARRYQREKVDYLNVEWRPQAWQWIDPEKDANAVITEIRGGLMSRTAAVAGRGYDVEAVDAEQASDHAREDGLGLAYDSDGRRPKNGATAQPQSKPQEQQP